MRKLDSLDGFEGHSVFLSLDRQVIGRDIDEIRKKLQLLMGNFAVDSYAEQQEAKKVLEALLERHPVIVGTMSIGRAAVLESSAHSEHPHCPAWATDEERKQFDALVEKLHPSKTSRYSLLWKNVRTAAADFLKKLLG